MLAPQIVVDLFPQICAGLGSLKHDRRSILHLPRRSRHRVSQQNDWPDGDEHNHPESNQLR
jgi:hypothetical protein